MQKMTCKCDCAFDVEYEKTIDLDVRPTVKDDIKTGAFLSFVCPACRSKANVELETVFIRKSKKTKLLFVPEKKRLECLAFSVGAVRVDAENNRKIKTEFVKKGQTPVGYPELADLVAALEADCRAGKKKGVFQALWLGLSLSYKYIHTEGAEHEQSF